MRHLARFYILFSWSVFIFIMLTFPTPVYVGTVISWHDKIFHIFLFGVFTYLFVYFLNPFRQIKLPFAAAIGFLAAISYSTLGEYIQNFVPGRTVSVYDFYAGALGAALAAIIAYARYKRTR